MPVFAITGSICSGKSTLLFLFKKMGAIVFDADKKVHQYYSNKESAVYKKIKKYFPIVFVNKRIVRKKLSKLVLNDTNKLRLLEKIVHPFIIKDLKKWIKKVRKENKVAFAEVPLLFEKNLENYFDGVIVLSIKENLLIKRIQKKYKVSKEEAIERLKLFLPTEEKLKKATFIIENNKDIKSLYKEAKNLWEKIY
ncbi:MAG: dephospho-CoA kinase [Candidatus Omnitrophica bacterium]|nr:dephospho-CoA kinase [Candidatus Omnitrophota bacterium]MCM8830788.1 dephospho-CoA kinase [Candidatus Omnitrophota bacterium]